MKLKFPIAVAIAGLLASSVAFAQTGNARARGNAVDADSGQRLPGVTVTFASANLQGVRAVMTDAQGTYSAPPLPPGDYDVTFELDGYQTVTQKVRLNAGQDHVIDARMPLGVIEEELVVTSAAAESISDTSTASTTMTYEDLSRLPTNRTLQTAVGLAPGVSNAGRNITISGAQSWDNLFTLNGVVLNENIRGTAPNLFIEDAIQETTVSQSGISAEYGRFTGGVVTAVTKSGGNEFEGSFRVNMTNEDWRSDNDFSPATRPDNILETYEATVGGRIIRDRVWFFLAGRDAETSGTRNLALTNVTVPTGRAEERYEYKLTGAITPSHQLRGAYSEIDDVQFNIAHGNAVTAVVADDGSFDAARQLPWELKIVDYTGVITPSFFVEAQASERTFFFQGSGGSDDDVVTGTPVFDLARVIAYNESIFCDDTAIPDCISEERSNEQARLKGSYFLSTSGAGSHDISFGAETFTDIRASDNHQSPNDMMIWNFNPSDISGTNVTPVFTGDGSTYLVYLPILNPTQGTDFQTDSVFVNDRWRLNDNWSFNLGARYDTLDAVNAAGNAVADSSAVSPRLGASWDIGGDGKSVAHLAIGKYTGNAASGIFDSSSPAGSPAAYYIGYFGPNIPRGTPTVAAVDAVFDWIYAECPQLVGVHLTLRSPASSQAQRDAAVAAITSCSLFTFSDVPGATTVLDDGLKTTSADEIALGFAQEFSRGSIRLDYTHREFGDFFATQRDLTTGQGVDPNGNAFDLGIVVNNDSQLERVYDAVSLAASFRFLENKLKVGGNVTWANARGNVDGETTGSGPVSDASLQYPEYKDPAWNSPRGRLDVDQRLRGRLWVLYDLLRTNNHYVNVSLLQNYTSGDYYSATANVNTRNYVTNPGYATPGGGATQLYFFSGRGEFQTDDITSTDLAINYSFKLGRFEAFVQPQLLNAFNEDGAIAHNATVTLLAPFNPFTTTPVEGTHWRKGPSFGQPTSEASLQRTREFVVSAGLRWNPF